MEMRRRKYDRQFKEEAVRLILQEGRKTREVAGNLGINESLLSRWKREHEMNGAGAFPGKGHLRPQDEEMRQLRKQLSDVTMERDILKKAVAIFSRQPK
jgi:transposase